MVMKFPELDQSLIMYILIWGSCIVGSVIMLRVGTYDRDKRKIAIGVLLAFMSIVFGYYYTPLNSSDIPELFKAYIAVISIMAAVTVYSSYKESYSGVYEISILKDKYVVFSLGIAGSIIYIAIFGVKSYISYIFTYIFAYLFIFPMVQMIRDKQIDVRRAFSMAAASIALPVIAYVAHLYGIEVDIIQPVLSAVVLSLLLVPVIMWVEEKI